jgi:hypothetical protein
VDEAHALAVRNLSVTAAAQCGVVTVGAVPDGLPPLPIELSAPVELRVAPPHGALCGDTALNVSGQPGETVRIAVDGAPPTAHYLASPEEIFTAPFRAGAVTHSVRVELLGAPERGARLTDVRVTAHPCE